MGRKYLPEVLGLLMTNMFSFLQGEKAPEIPALGARGLSLRPTRQGVRSFESVHHQLLTDIMLYAICIILSIIKTDRAALNLQKAFKKVRA